MAIGGVHASDRALSRAANRVSGSLDCLFARHRFLTPVRIDRMADKKWSSEGVR